MKKNLLAIHPLLFAVYPILALYSNNVAEVSPYEIVMPAAIVLGLTLLPLLLSGLIFRDVMKAAIIVSIFLVLFFSYEHVIAGWRTVDRVLMPIWGILFICIAYFVIKTRGNLRNLTIILNVIATALLIIPTISIIIHEVMVPRQDIRPAEKMEMNTVDLGKADNPPDIYYIILDRYASGSTLEEVYDFDNSEFIDYLSNRGFYVASESRSNHLKSRASLASSLNMEFLDYLSDELGEECSDLGPMYAMLQDYKVWRFLKLKGYRFVHFGSWWEPTRENKYADMNVNYKAIPEFSLVLLKTTILYPILVKLHFIDDTRVTHWKRVLYKFDKLAEIPSIREPTFVFCHMLIPHGPYIFERNGNYIPGDEAYKRSRTENYVNQLVFTNKKVRVLIDELLSRSEKPPIIILQSDEGPSPRRLELLGLNFKWEEATEGELRENMTILNAYYLPNIDKNVLYPSITPVNSFRLVFNLYFDTDFELLPDKSFATYSGHPYNFFDVTDKVKYD